MDARSAKVVRTRDLARHAPQEALVFDTNALVAQPGPRGLLADADDLAGPEFDPLYETKSLPRLGPEFAGECLIGDYVEVYLFDNLACSLDGDFTTVVDPDDPPNRIPTTRAHDEFEAGMAYFHIDRVQDYLQGVGVLNANNRRTRVDVNFIAEDNSFYLPDTDSIVFGEGGVDDAEDGEVIVHEYGHAIQDNQVPGFGETPQGGAMGEGFSDYLAAAIATEFAQRDGYDACIAEWDYSFIELVDDPPCLRRVDRNITFAQAQAGQGCSDPGEFIYCGGEAWSGALWDIRTQLGIADDVADRKVLESHDSLTPQSDLHSGALALVAAYDGHPEQAAVRGLLIQRGLLDTERLDDLPGSAVPLAVPGLTHRLPAVRPRQRRRAAHRAYGGAGRGDQAARRQRRLRSAAPASRDQLAEPVRRRGRSGRDRRLQRGSRPPSHEHRPVLPRRACLPGPGQLHGGGADRPRLRHPARRRGQLSWRLRTPARRTRTATASVTRATASPTTAPTTRTAMAARAEEDNCPAAANSSQTDWDGDDLGDACDRSKRVTLKRLRTRGRKVTLRVTFRPTLLGARAVTLRVQRRKCKRCKFGKVTSIRRGKDRGQGRVDFTVKVRRGISYRFRANLADKRFGSRSRSVSLRLR